MNLTISGHHVEVTPSLKTYVLSKLDRVTRHFDQMVGVTVLLTVENLKEKDLRQKAEVTLHVKGKDIFVQQSEQDLYAAIDLLMDKLDRQVGRHKGRMQQHRKPHFKHALGWPDGTLAEAGEVSAPALPAKRKRTKIRKMGALAPKHERDFFASVGLSGSPCARPVNVPKVTAIA